MKRWIPILLTLLLLLGLCGCGGGMKASDQAMRAEPAYAPEEALYDAYGETGAPEAEAVSGGNAASGGAAEGQKLIRKVHLSAETEDYYAFMDKLSKSVDELGGYLENVEARTSGSLPSASLTIRVPAERLSELTAQVTGYSNITYRSESQQNVTLQYVDTESRIEALKTEQDRLLELLSQAEDLEAILQIEDRLAEVRYQLGSYESSLRALANQVDYATVTLEVRQVEVFTPVEKAGYWESAGNGFVSSLQSIGTFFKNLFADLIAALPYLLLLIGLPALIVVLVVRAIRKKRKAAVPSQPVRPQPEPQFSGPQPTQPSKNETNGQ